MTFRDIAANLANLNASYGRTPENFASGVTMGLLLRLHRESKKQDTKLLAITSLTIIRFSEIFQ